MTENNIIGAAAVSKAGHDKDRSYIIIEAYKGFVWLCDGKKRKLELPKKKSIKHIRILKHGDADFAGRVLSNSITDEEIKYFLRHLEVMDV